MRNILLTLIVGIMFVGIASASYCYQETANVSTACGGLATGVYGGTCGSASYDGNWVTSDTSNCNLTVNYSKPTYSNRNSIFVIQNYNSGTGLWTIENKTIPSACWNSSNILSFNIWYTYIGAPNKWQEVWDCWDGSSWVNVAQSSTLSIVPGIDYNVWEEAMIWNITTSGENISVNNPPNFTGYSPMSIGYNTTNGVQSCYYTHNNGISTATVSPLKFDDFNDGIINYTYWKNLTGKFDGTTVEFVNESSDYVHLYSQINAWATSITSWATLFTNYTNVTQDIRIDFSLNGSFVGGGNHKALISFRNKTTVADFVDYGQTLHVYSSGELATLTSYYITMNASSGNTSLFYSNGTIMENIILSPAHRYLSFESETDAGSSVGSYSTNLFIFNYSTRYYGQNGNLNCYSPITFIPYKFDNQFIFYGIDSEGTTVSSTGNFTIPYLINSVSYNPTAYISSSEAYSINISYDSARYSSMNVFLIYNGTTLGTTRTGEVYTTNTTTPSGNFNFYWQIVLTNSSGLNYYNSSTYSQTISSVPYGIFLSSGTTCGTGTSAAYYFDFADETSRENVSLGNNVNFNVKYSIGSITSGQNTINGTFSNIANFSICINNSATNSIFLKYGEVQYSNTGYTDRRFYLFEDQLITNITSSNKLYLLNNSLATSFIIGVYSNEIQPLSGMYTAMLRWYPEINQYLVVEMGKTDEKGQTIARVKTETVDYRTAIYYPNGTLLKLVNPVRMACTVTPCTYNNYVNTQNAENLLTKYNVQTDISFNDTTKVFTFTWNDPAMGGHEFNFMVYKVMSTGPAYICNTTSAAFTGVTTCDVSAYVTGKDTFYAEIYRHSTRSIIGSSVQQIWNNRLKDVAGGNGGTMGLFIGMMIVMLAVLMGAWAGPYFAVMFGMIAFIPIWLIGVISTPAFLAILALGGIAMWFLPRT